MSSCTPGDSRVLEEVQGFADLLFLDGADDHALARLDLRAGSAFGSAHELDVVDCLRGGVLEGVAVVDREVDSSLFGERQEPHPLQERFAVFESEQLLFESVEVTSEQRQVLYAAQQVLLEAAGSELLREACRKKCFEELRSHRSASFKTELYVEQFIGISN